jgi:hypothetical protein
MKTRFTVALSMFAGIAVGAVAVHRKWAWTRHGRFASECVVGLGGF